MLLVNNPGTWSAIYWPLDHAEWHGWTPTDLIFPFFLFIVGITTELSRKEPKGILRRGLLIIACGVLLHLFPYFHFTTLRYFGVLQRIGIVYILAALIASVGVLLDSAILVVGAMVVGPEFGPVAGLCVALVERRGRPAWLSLRALLVAEPAGV